MEIDQLLARVLEKIKPSEDETKRIKSAARELMETVSKKLGKETLFVGSAAKNTHLKGTSDLDIFVLYPKGYPREKMSEETIAVGKEVLEDPVVEYAEHPYVRGKWRGYEVDLVPCYKIKLGERIESAVDRTPLHLQYVQAKGKGLEDEIRLLKQFMKGIGVYGAEIKVKGFSGYLCEILVIYYGSFMDVIKNAAKWKPPVVLDPEKYYQGREAPFSGPLIVVDPVDPNRNVAAPVSINSFSKFVLAANAFLRNPSEKFFFPPQAKPMRKEDLKQALMERKTELYALILNLPKISEDILWGELEKFSRVFEKNLRLEGFPPQRIAIWKDESMAVIVFELSYWHRSGTEVRIGPPAWEFEHVQKFLTGKQVLAGPYVKDGRICVEVPRETKAERIIPQILEKIRKKYAAFPHVREALENAGILRNRGILTLYLKNEEFAAFLTRYFTTELPWLEL